MELRIDRELNCLHTLNFLKASDIQDSFSQILVEAELTQAEIGLCSSKIFVSDQNFFLFLEEYVSHKDRLYTESRKVVYRLISRYIKIRANSLNDYLVIIFEKCIKLYKKDESNICKVAALWPIITMIKHVHEFKDLNQIIKPLELVQQLNNELKFCKLLTTVKGTVWQLIGLIIGKFNMELNKSEGRIIIQELQTTCLFELKLQITKPPPDLAFIEGALKFFRMSLCDHKLSTEQIDQLFSYFNSFITEIKDVKQHKIIIGATKTLRDNITAFDANILVRSEEFFDKLMALIHHSNRDVKERASELFEKYFERLAEKLEEDEKRHKKIFNLIMDRFFDIIRGQDKDLFVLTVVIRTVGIFAKAIVKIRGDEYLSHFFEELIKLSESKIIAVFDKYQNISRQESIKQGLSFKVVLYQQKQVNSFIISFANLIRNLNFLSDYQVHHLYNMCILAVKQHLNFYETYKPYLYEGLVIMILSFQNHPSYALLFVQRLISEGFNEGLKLGEYLSSISNYLYSANEMAKLWIGLIQQEKLWTQHTLQIFVDIFLNQINIIVSKTNFGSKLSTNESQRDNSILQLMGNAQQQFYISNAPKELIFFHRMTLVTSQVLSNIPSNCFKDSLILILRNACNQIRKNPRAILIIIFTRIIFKHIRDNNLLVNNLNTQIQKKINLIVMTLIQRITKFLTPLVKIYSGQLLEETLNLLLNVPIEIVVNDNFLYLKQSYKEILHQGFQQGHQSLSLAFSAVQQLVDLVLETQKLKNNTQFKLLLRYIKEVIPCLSGYLQTKNNGNSSDINQQYQQQMLDDNLDFSLDEPTNTRNLEQSFNLIDQIYPFKRLLNESKQNHNSLMLLVKNFLGSIGGLCHMIVDSSINKNTLLAWDYGSPMTFPLPLDVREFYIRIGILLPRILEACQNSQNEQIKKASGELLHALTIYLIGESASLTNQISAKDKSERAHNISMKKSEYAGILGKIYPVLLRIGAGLSGIHPCKLLFTSLLMQTARWYANTKQYEAPDVGQLLDSLMEEPCHQENPQMEQLSSEVLGEFVKWTLKQTTSQEIMENYGNFKTIIKRIQTFVSHPDIRKKKVGLLCIEKLVENTKFNYMIINRNECFIVEKYYMELSTFIKLTSDVNQDFLMNERLDQKVCSQLSQSLSKFNKQLNNEVRIVKRSGQFDTLTEFLDWLLDEVLTGIDSIWEFNALQMLGDILQSNVEGLPSLQKFLLKKSVSQTKCLFAKQKLRYVSFGVEDPNFLLLQTKHLNWQCKLWIFLQKKQVFIRPSEFLNFNDFSETTLINIVDYFTFFAELKIQQQQQLKNNQQSLFFDLYQTLSQDNYFQGTINMGSIGNQDGQQKLISLMSSSFPEDILLSFIQLFNGIYVLLLADDQQYIGFILQTTFQRSQEQLLKVTCGLILRPSYYLIGLQNYYDQFQIPLDSLINNAKQLLLKAISVYKLNNFFLTIMVPVLTDIFEGKFKFEQTSINELILGQDTFKDISDMKIFLLGLKWISSMTIYDLTQESTRFLNGVVQNFVELIKLNEERNDNEKENQRLLFQKDKLNELGSEKISILLDFSFTSDNEFLDQFCIDVLLSNGNFKQKYESMVVEYLAKRFLVIGQIFLQKASNDLNLFKYLVHLIQMIHIQPIKLKVFMENLPQLQIDRNLESFLSIEIKSNSMILSYLSNDSELKNNNIHNSIYMQDYLKRVLNDSFQHTHSLDIHREGLVLFGLYVKLSDQIMDRAQKERYEFRLQNLKSFQHYLNNKTQDLLTVFRSKYFPLKVRELLKDSIEETNFKSILKSLIDMINLTGRIEFIQMINPIIREDLQSNIEIQISDFVKTFIQENFLVDEHNKDISLQIRQQCQLKDMMEQVMNQQIDPNPRQNLRVALAEKILIPMLQNSTQESLVYFYSLFGRILDRELGKTTDLNDQWNTIILWIQIQIILMDLVQTMYRYLAPDRIKNEVHKNIYGADSLGNEFTKKVVTICQKIKKTKFEKLHILDQASQKVEYNDYDYQKLLINYCASSYSCLAFTSIATQNKENVLHQLLFQQNRQKGELIWESLVDTRRIDFEFKIETQFNEVNLQKLNKIKQSKTHLKDQIVNDYLQTSSLGSTSQYQSQFIFQNEEQIVSNIKIEEELPPAQQLIVETKLEMDEINQHRCMIPLLQVVDFLEQKFPSNSNDMPLWMVSLYEEVIQENTSLAVKIFIIKLIINRVDVFFKHSQSWLEILLQYASKENKPNGGIGFHYFLRDVIVVIIKWSEDDRTRQLYLQKFPLSKQLLSSVCNNLILSTAHEEVGLFQQNIEILSLLFSLWKDNIFISALTINKMIAPDKKNPENILWLQNAFAVLQVALFHNVPILIDYQDYIKEVNAPVNEKYKYFLMVKQSQQNNFPFQYLAKMASNALTKKNVLKSIARTFGMLCRAIDRYHQVNRDMLEFYEQEINRILLKILEDNRPGYAKERFCVFTEVVVKEYPKILNNQNIFMKCSELIVLATSNQRANILMMFYNFLIDIGQHTRDPQSQISEITLTIQGSMKKIFSDQDPNTQIILLRILLLLTSVKYINYSQSTILGTLKSIIPALKEYFDRHQNYEVVDSYVQILIQLYEYINDDTDQKELRDLIVPQLLRGFTSQHSQIRSKVFLFFEKDRERKGSTQQMMDKLIGLLGDIYDENQETLWLRSAVPLLLSMSKKTSDYDRMLFKQPLEIGAQFYDIDFRTNKYFSKANLSQQNFNGTQQPSTQGSLLSQAVHFQRLGGVRATQLQSHENLEQQLIQDRVAQQQIYSSQQYNQDQMQAEPFTSSLRQDSDGFIIPFPKNNKTRQNMRSFLSTNQLSSQQVNLNSSRQIRYNPSQSQNNRSEQTELFRQRNQQGPQAPGSQDKGFQFMANQTRKYRIGELPDIMIKRKDIIDPLIEFTFEDEEIAGTVFTILFQQIYIDSSVRQKNLYDTLLNLLERSKQKSLFFISTIIKTIYEVSFRSNVPFPKSEVIKRIGVESFAFYQSMLLIEESILLIENDDTILEDQDNEDEDVQIIDQPGRRRKVQKISKQTKKKEEQSIVKYKNLERYMLRMGYWMDLIDLHQKLGNNDQIQGILSNIMDENEDFTKKLNFCLKLKLQGQILKSKEELGQLLLENTNQQSNDLLKDRMSAFIQNEYDDALQKLGEWEELDIKISLSTQNNPQIIDTLSVEQLKKISHRYIRFNQREDDIFQLRSLFETLEKSQNKKRLLFTDLAFENSIVYLLNNDLDMARFSIEQSDNHFINKWSQLTQGNNSLLTNDLKHIHLEILQRNYEFREFVNLMIQKELSLQDFMQLFGLWKQRNPSVIYDSINAWDLILQTRLICANQLTDIMSIEMFQLAKPKSQWITQNAQGMIRKGFYEQANYLIKDAYELTKEVQERHEFEWEFYKTTAKVELKKLELFGEDKDRSQIISDLSKNINSNNVDEFYSKYYKLSSFFQKKFKEHKEIIKDYHIRLKFQLLPMQCLESYVDVTQDIIFLMAQFQRKNDNKQFQGFTQFYTKYAEVTGELINHYDQINLNISQIENLSENENNNELLQVQRKFFSQAAGFFERCLRLLEPDVKIIIQIEQTGGSENLRQIIRHKMDINLETIAEGFFKYTVRLFQVGFRSSTQFSKMEGILIKLLKVVYKFPHTIGENFLQVCKNNTLPSWIFLSYIPQIMHTLKNQNLSSYFQELFVQLAKKYPEQFVYQFNVSHQIEEECKTSLAKDLYQYLRKVVPMNFEFIDALNMVVNPEHRINYYLSKLGNCDQSSQKEIAFILSQLERDVFDQNSDKKLGQYNRNFISKFQTDFQKLRKNYLDGNQIKCDMDIDRNKELKKQTTDLMDRVKKISMPTGHHKLSDFSKWFSFYIKNQEEIDKDDQFSKQNQSDIDLQLTGRQQNLNTNQMKQEYSNTQQRYITVPGQLQQSSTYYVEPDELSSIKIASFDESILILGSIRKPKRITIYGSDEKSYQILVKGGEDLRLDQRIEQLFSVMNSFFEATSETSKKDLKISTFAVIPMTKSLGVLEWVGSTKVLKEILEKEYEEQHPGKDLGVNNPAYNDREVFLKRECSRLKLFPKQNIEDVRKELQHQVLLILDEQNIKDHINKLNNFIPQDLLREALKRLSSSLEAFAFIRDRFIKNYSVICITGYILGIGDRHLENFLLNFSTGEALSIDFGYSFGQGLSLFLPELMPFRLTRVFEGLTKPVGLNGIFRHSMIHTLTSLRKNRYVLMDFCEVFINDPLLDQMKIAKDKNASKEFLSQILQQQQLEKEIYSSRNQRNSVESENYFQQSSGVLQDKQESVSIEDKQKLELMWYPYKKIDIMRKKLMGVHSSLIMIEELNETQHHDKKQVKDAVMGKNRPRAKLQQTSEFETNLSVVDQVDCLIDHATDPNIIGRTWIGWTPYI